ncbi:MULTISPECIES: hypothetical protein [unclassified Streptomyces]|uniref:hypothetical protein n=1 Tax=unclassified Streptomyces TaxID=2593676 RepID=UPI00278C3995|nr:MULTISPECIES: hypothetical protein [unclassified Streptomyces]
MNSALLYARSRSAPATLALITATALFTLWAATLTETFIDPYRRIPLLALGPLAAASAIGTSLHQRAPELDRTAARPWWPTRLAHLLALTALAATTLALSVPGHSQEFGAAAMARNVLGATGLTATATVLLGARLSWLPPTLYFGAVYLSYSAPGMKTATLWTWSMQPGPQRGAWAVALVAFMVGTMLYVAVGPRRKRR